MSVAKRPIQKIACVGEVMIELVSGEGSAATLGVAGDTFNTAVYMARLLQDKDVSVSYVTALGTDRFTDRILDALGSHNIDTSYIERRSDKLPGLYAIETDDAGERSFSYWRSDAAARTLFSEPCQIGLDVLHDHDMVVLSGITLAILPVPVRQALIESLKRFAAEGGTLVFDSNYRPKLWESVDAARDFSTQMWAACDIALPSVDDEMALFGDPDEGAVVSRLKAIGVDSGALKRGGEGPFDLSGQAAPQSFPQAETILDSTAAGDSFNAGYLAQVVLGGDTGQAMLQGHVLAATVIGFKGAIIPANQVKLL